MLRCLPLHIFFCIALLCSVPTRCVPSPVFASPFCVAPTFAHPVSVWPPLHLPPPVFARPSHLPCYPHPLSPPSTASFSWKWCSRSHFLAASIGTPPSGLC